jgi:hypothetical protein
MTRLVACCACLLIAANSLASENNFIPRRVAHAGGGINGETYTNSYEALDLNKSKGFLYFEIDFSFTKDDKLACIHDWNISFKKAFGFEISEKPTLAELTNIAKNKSKYELCTLDGLAEWMRNNPETILVTDIKENNLKALSILRGKIPEASTRVIPQIYQPWNYRAVKNIGYESIIWTLYKYSGSNNSVLDWSEQFDGSFAITMPIERAESNLPILLSKKYIPTYVHTINNRKQFTRLIDLYNVTEIYTDFLSPAQDQ